MQLPLSCVYTFALEWKQYCGNICMPDAESDQEYPSYKINRIEIYNLTSYAVGIHRNNNNYNYVATRYM